ncbi:MAG: hypothetical protein K6U11_12220, partial [bacterium]|nr:hypothetical protein [bacterium]
LSSLFIFSPPLYIFNIIFSTWGTSASPLKSSQGNIPAARVLVKPADGNYHPLDREVVVLQRPFRSERNPTSTTRLWFKLQTGWDDPAGEYSGTITFTCLPPP